MIQAALHGAVAGGLAPACAVLGVARATAYRHRARAAAPPARRPGLGVGLRAWEGGGDGACAATRPGNSRALSPEERTQTLAVLRAPENVDRSIAQVYHQLLDAGTYLCSPRTMHRLLAARGESGERRNQLRHPVHAKPELAATAPNQVWTWDITKLLTFEKWRYLYLYVILDLFSRFVVGWLIAPNESQELAWRLFADALERWNITPGTVRGHMDRGAPMTGKTYTQKMADLQVPISHGRPRVSNDNPFSESQFKTLKYHPSYPERFAGLDDGRGWCHDFFRWYNYDHRHVGIAYLTPATVHFGKAAAVLAARQAILAGAYARNPARFRQLPVPGTLPPAVYINPPAKILTPEVIIPTANPAFSTLISTP